jgi:hypothetical protein
LSCILKLDRGGSTVLVNEMLLSVNNDNKTSSRDAWRVIVIMASSGQKEK